MDELRAWRDERVEALGHDLPSSASVLAEVRVTDPLSEPHDAAARRLWELEDELDRLGGGQGLDRADWPRPGSWRHQAQSSLPLVDARDVRLLGEARRLGRLPPW